VKELAPDTGRLRVLAEMVADPETGIEPNSDPSGRVENDSSSLVGPRPVNGRRSSSSSSSASSSGLNSEIKVPVGKELTLALIKITQ
jgi:hypothetical protein